MKYPKVPAFFMQSPSNYGLLRVSDFLAIASFEHTRESTGSMFLEEHLLLFVLDGENTLTNGERKHVVSKDHMILLEKATIWDFRKEGNPGNNNIYGCMLFFLKDEFLKDFVKMADVKLTPTDEPVVTCPKPVNRHLKAYLNSIKPYFDNPENIDQGLLRLKIMELLYGLALTDNGLLRQILQLRQPIKSDIISVMEQNYTKRISLPELAFLSGRSLSSFKRDFMAVCSLPPSKWIREKRLEKSKELLLNTALSITDVCYMVGFENATHYSRLFKQKYGYAPSENRQKMKK